MSDRPKWARKAAERIVVTNDDHGLRAVIGHR